MVDKLFSISLKVGIVTKVKNDFIYELEYIA